MWFNGVSLRLGRWNVGLVINLVASLALSACTSAADVFPMNAEAKKIGDPTIQFVRQGIDQGPVTITMPSGEVLHGHYQVAREGAVGMAFSNGRSATAIGVGGGGVQFVARGPNTEMLCRGSVSFGGHGAGQCQTVEGAVWSINY